MKTAYNFSGNSLILSFVVEITYTYKHVYDNHLCYKCLIKKYLQT